MPGRPHPDLRVTRFAAPAIGVTLMSQDNVNVTRILEDGIRVTRRRRHLGLGSPRDLGSPRPLIHTEA